MDCCCRRARKRGPFNAKDKESVSSIQSLPDENIIHILQYFADDAMLGGWEWVWQKRLVPIRLVCRRMNRIITTFPDFWTQICSWKPDTALYIQRSRSRPLDVAIRLDPFNSRIVDLFGDTVHRWKLLDIRSDESKLVPLLAGRYFLGLRRMTLVFQSVESRPAPHVFTQVIPDVLQLEQANYPSLEHLHVEGPSTSAHYPMWGISLADLHSLKILQLKRIRIDFQGFITVFCGAPNVEELGFVEVVFTDHQHSLRTLSYLSFGFRSLTTFRWTGQHGHYPKKTVLRWLLHNMTFSGKIQNLAVPWIAPMFEDVPTDEDTRFNCTIFLSLHDRTANGDRTYPLADPSNLRRFSGLTTLDLSDHLDDQAVDESLRYLAKRKDTCPHLSTVVAKPRALEAVFSGQDFLLQRCRRDFGDSCRILLAGKDVWKYSRFRLSNLKGKVLSWEDWVELLSSRGGRPSTTMARDRASSLGDGSSYMTSVTSFQPYKCNRGE